ncbi:MAG: LacI family DNA-binding transcriptional regulator [Verrucomicrobia bacterium]|nr:LacI family DNA-binding transcriptional regulator [Verrucomicrobiota bacterium]MCH8527525.1 LacI family DNA-binding transcriptional regulator [Kiritimatiellia bacterium]
MIKAAEAPSLRDIAHVLGVTPTTVSLALRGSPRISSRTRNKVKQTAEDMGYRPNAELSRVMSHLKTRRGRDIRPVIALVTGGGSRAAAASVRGVFQDIAETAGYTVDVLDFTQAGMNLERLAGILTARGIRGGILYRLEAEAPRTREWLKGLALCCVGAPPPGVKLPSCDWEESAGGTCPEEPLLGAAMDMLDLAIQHNRYGEAGHGMTLRLH